MILVNGNPVASVGTVGGGEDDFTELKRLVSRLLVDPVLVDSSESFKAAALQIIKPPHPSGNEDNSSAIEDVDGCDFTGAPKFLYVLQREVATVGPVYAELIGTDEITTCLGLVIRDPLLGLTSVGHFDSAESVVTGVNQMLSSVVSGSSSALQVHLVGAYDDSIDHNVKDGSEQDNVGSRPGSPPGYSWRHVLAMIDTLQKSSHIFEMETCCILQHNTAIGPSGYPFPIVRGIVVETSSGRIMPARFEPEARGPDATVRAVYTTTLNFDANCQPSLLSPYETASDNFVLHPFTWDRVFEKYAAYMLTLDDSKLLETFSTSPHAESADFLLSSRRIFSYIKKFPDWQQTFPNNQPRRFARTRSGGWIPKKTLSL